MADSCLQELVVREQHFGHADRVDEQHDVGLGDRAADRLELAPERQVLEMDAEADRFDISLAHAQIGSQGVSAIDGTFGKKLDSKAGIACSAIDSGVQPSERCTERIMRIWLKK